MNFIFLFFLLLLFNNAFANVTITSTNSGENAADDTVLVSYRLCNTGEEQGECLSNTKIPRHFTYLPSTGTVSVPVDLSKNYMLINLVSVYMKFYLLSSSVFPYEDIDGNQTGYCFNQQDKINLYIDTAYNRPVHCNEKP